MSFNQKILHKALGEPGLLLEAEIQQLAQWAKSESARADSLAHDLRRNPERTERIKWVASITGLVVVAIGIIAACIVYFMMDTRDYDTEQMREQACALRQDAEKMRTQLNTMCNNE